jgi:hypothetical protein
MNWQVAMIGTSGVKTLHLSSSHMHVRFLVELRNIAVDFRVVSASTRNRMKGTACLVASRRASRTFPEKRSSTWAGDDTDDEDEKKMEHDLLVPNQVRSSIVVSSYFY